MAIDFLDEVKQLWAKYPQKDDNFFYGTRSVSLTIVDSYLDGLLNLPRIYSHFAQLYTRLPILSEIDPEKSFRELDFLTDGLFKYSIEQANISRSQYLLILSKGFYKREELPRQQIMDATNSAYNILKTNNLLSL